jgi:hypothetical protein
MSIALPPPPPPQPPELKEFRVSTPAGPPSSPMPVPVPVPAATLASTLAPVAVLESDILPLPVHIGLHYHGENAKPTPHMPPSISGLRAIARPAAWTLLLKFFASATPPIKLHVHDLDAHANAKGVEETIRNTLCGRRLQKCSETSFAADDLDVAHDSLLSYCREFGAEVLLSESIAQSAYHTNDATNADFIFIVSCIMSRGTAGQYQTQLSKLLEVDPVVNNRFNQAAARDTLVVTLTADHGPCYNRKEKLGSQQQGGKNFEWNSTGRWINPDLKGMTIMTHEGSRIGLGCYDRSFAFTIPTGAGSLPFNRLKCGLQRTDLATLPVHEDNLHPTRQNLVFFSGKKSAGVRNTVTKVVARGNLSVYHEHARFQYPEYICAMRSSVFCVAPRGNAVWSPRLDEAVMAGCIPIVVADRYDPPYAHIVDYTKFAVRVSQAQVKQLPRILAQISEEDREMMRFHGRAMVSIFRFGAGAGLAAGLDLSPLVAFQLWVRAKGHQEELDEHWDQRDTKGNLV